MTLGVHFALTAADEARLLAAAGDDDTVLAIIDEIEERAIEGMSCDTDKAWDAIHRCLTDGRLEYANGDYPLNAAVLGGRQLVEAELDTVSYVRVDQVRDVAAALDDLGEEWLRARYEAIDPLEYGPEYGEDDFDYTWDSLQDLREFYAGAAAAGRAVVFTVSS